MYFIVEVGQIFALALVATMVNQISELKIKFVAWMSVVLIDLKARRLVEAVRTKV